MRYQVIVGVPHPDGTEAWGNLASVMELYQAGNEADRVTRVDPMVSMIQFRTPVFVLGEILIVDNDGREVCGRARKASKWSVQAEEFDTLEEAVARAQEVGV